jgi:hypothetical protein
MDKNTTVDKNLAITQKVMILMSPEELAEGLHLLMEKYPKPNPQPSFETEKMDRRKAAKFLDVSYQTMCNWTKSGILTERGQGRKKFYLRSELIQVMQKTIS